MSIRAVDEQYDIVVCGGGLAGFCAAVSAARGGARVCLVQDRPVFGGNSSSEIRVPPQGAASFHAYARETGIISELLIEERARNHEEPTHDNGWINSVWDMVLYDMAVTTPNLSFHLNTIITDVMMKDERTVEAVIGRVNHAETVLTLRASTFIDCTGDGIVADLAGCEWRMGTEGRDEFGEPHAPEAASHAVMGNSIHFKAKDMGRPIPFKAPEWAVSYNNPDFFYKQGRWPGELRSGYWWIELSVPWHTIYDNERLRHELTRHVLGIWDWIKNRDPELKGPAANYVIDWIGQVPGKRESRRIIGQYLMTEYDPLNRTVFPDEVAYGGWFVDLHEPGGLLAPFSERSAIEGHQSSYTAKSYVGPYGIPLRILIAKNMSNLMMAGRNVSVTHAALGTIRVMGTTALMGQAAGTAAAVAVREGIPVRDIPTAQGIREVQQALLRDGCFLPNVVNEDPNDLARMASVSASSEAKLIEMSPSETSSADMRPKVGETLEQRRGQWIAIGGESLDTLTVCLGNETNLVQAVEARLYAVDHIWDYRVEPGQALEKAVLAVEPGMKQWVEWPIGLDVSDLKGKYVRLDLLKQPHIRWHTAENVEPAHVSAYDLGNGQMRRFGSGLTMSFRIAPGQACYGASNVLSGVTRPYRYPNVWRSDPSQPMPQYLELYWEQAVVIGRIELTFPGHLFRDYRSYPALYRDPQCPKDLKAEAYVEGRWVEIGSLKDNYQRKRTVIAVRPIHTVRLRITVLATNGDPSAAIYEVRCYTNG
ncbi:FAD-dependent oxidoreductase [Cohnella sp.]|uniref:FAD-dependent oxidoreductase n=1 Tax=Cohnella sp. TaxID=1883426 RepID=UPI00356140D7